ncbi:MarR family winged helix-turn-helix transcriptional regulator [Chryseobacterium herbae]|uniref:MarR family winged helix-turn-helix transcriptional regulator n=1 Tax=Chryseobacterium herbae TaxID=2976476 RepID=A0ABT2ITD6_9FLAO|nr:helix-turn-helix domain-containing protein [Chryseobacterium sp. pc1-10]MCT2561761.1 MarR family winged helix-turn-helix transcriptional regulator [Chryseobacterium sp. pc1-10]
MKSKDFLKEVKLAGLTSRLKRLSDNILYSTKDFYKSVDADIEPNWHLIFLLLKESDSLTIIDISERLQLSHPAVVKIIKKMKAAGYVKTNPHSQDSRKQILTLTPKAIQSLPKFEKYWDACVLTMLELLEGNSTFLDSLGKIEEKINESSYKERTLNNLKNKIK